MNASDHRPETRPSPPPAAQPAARFFITAAAAPGVMPRVIEQFARRGLVPERWHSVVNEDSIRIEVRVAGMDVTVASVLAATLRGTVDIHSVLSDDEPA
jgi:acetolactate synthase small subunit